MKEFDPNAAASGDSGLFGLPFLPEESALVILPVPWEATTSYGGGTSRGPRAILEASRQVDLFDLELGPFYKSGIAMLDESTSVSEWNKTAKKAAQPVIKSGGAGDDPKLVELLKIVNDLSEKLNQFVFTETQNWLKNGKVVGVVGGDHSSPFGTIQALSQKYPRLGILHIDAHADLRHAFEGFQHSHASIMYNVMTKTKVEKLVQVGIRDFCEEEFQFMKKHEGRIHTFFDETTSRRKFSGETWERIGAEIVNHLPKEVYISFDIDGLDPQLCPHTGTPVPGGLSFQEAVFLIRQVVESGRKIVGFDLNEVAPGPDGDEWDANVGARLLYKLCGGTLGRR